MAGSYARAARWKHGSMPMNEFWLETMVRLTQMMGREWGEENLARRVVQCCSRGWVEAGPSSSAALRVGYRVVGKEGNVW